MNTIKITTAQRRRPAVSVRNKRVREARPLTVTDDVLFRWARIVRIAKLFPVMHSIRALENRIQESSCRGCNDRNKNSDFDRTALDTARRLLAECSAERARQVKEAAGISEYRVQYHDLSGSVREVVR
jgi:pyrroloquinoline quinone (PQQ) biosynthesis protein C